MVEGCLKDVAIRHAVVAIAALDFSSECPVKEPSSDISRLKDADVLKHRQFAHRQYGTAIQLMRKSVSTNTIDIKSILVGCVVIACYEALNGNNDAAIMHIQSGLALMKNYWQGRNVDTTRPFQPRSAASKDIYDMMEHTFMSLDVQMLSFVYIRTKEAHERVRHFGSQTLRSMPMTFLHPKQALAYQQFIMRRIWHFNTSISAAAKYTASADKQSPSLDYVAIVKKEYQADLELFYPPFERLYQYTLTPEGAAFYHQLTGIKTDYLATSLILDGIPTDSFDSAAFELKSAAVLEEIVSLLEILTSPNARETYKLYIVSPLYVIGVKCRHIATRRRAIALLLSSKGKDKIWNGLLVAKALAWIASIEEDDAAGLEFLPSNVCEVDMELDFDSRGRSLRIKCSVSKYGVQKPIEKSTKIEV